MRILFTRFPLESAHGGAENQTQWLMEGLKMRGHSVFFLGSCPVLLDRAKKMDVGYQHCDIGSPPVTQWKAFSFLWRRKAMKAALINALEHLPHKPDCIVMLSLSEKLLLTKWAVAQGISVFWVEHDRVGAWLRKNPWLPGLKAASTHATMICVSERSKKLYIDMGFDSSRILAIANGIPPSSPTSFSQRKREEKETTNLLLGCVARLSSEKGIDVLLHAIADMPEVTLRMVGKGPQEGYLRMLIAEDTQRLGLGEPRITLTPLHSDLDSFYHEIDVLVLPSSDHEPFGLVAAEALSRGTPVIVTDVCGITDYLQEGKEIIVTKAGSSESLAAAIRKMRDVSTRSALAHAGQSAVISRLTVAAMVERYEKVLRT